MGNRANIHCYENEGDNGIWFYTHWSGLEGIKEAVSTALARAQDRWSDPAYLNRVIFQELVGDDKGTTGYGIDWQEGDNENPIVEVNYGKQEIKIEKDKWSFSEFIKQTHPKGK